MLARQGIRFIRIGVHPDELKALGPILAGQLAKHAFVAPGTWAKTRKENNHSPLPLGEVDSLDPLRQSGLRRIPQERGDQEYEADAGGHFEWYIPKMSEEIWKRCSSCKKPIVFRSKYWVCNVSTCNRKRTGLSFCSVSCWDAHVPLMNHRDSWAEERKAPTAEEWAKALSGDDKPARAPRKEKPEEAKPAAPAAQAPSQPARVILRRKAD